VLEQDKGLKLPKRMQADFSRVVQRLADETSRELNAADIWGAFAKHYRIEPPQRFNLEQYEEGRATNGDRIFTGKIVVDGATRSVSGRGNGLISSVLAAINDEWGVSLDVLDYSEHAIGQGSNVKAAAYVECKTPDGQIIWGVGIDEDVATASVRAVLNATGGVDTKGT
jgi:2-isopropylmalate synthase